MSSTPVRLTEESRANTADFLTYRRTGDRDVRDALALRYEGLALSLASRYRNRGVAFDDLRQVAMVGLLKAIDRFDPDHGAAFSSFAVPTILGELRRHFRDHGWTVSVPRRLQELRQRADAARERLGQTLGRAPTLEDISASLQEDPEDVLLALDGLRTAYQPAPLEPGHDDPVREDDPHHRVDDHLMVEELLATLPARQREIVVLRYWGGMTQREIADRVGLSQMHVSRLLRRSLDHMQAHSGAAP